MNRELVGGLLALLSFAAHCVSSDVVEEVVDEANERSLYEYSTQVSYSESSYRIALISGLTVSFGLLVYGITGFLMAVCFHGKTFSRGREQLQKERRRHLDEVNNTSGEKKLRKHRKHHDDDSYDEDDLDTITDDVKIEYKINDRNNKYFKSTTIDNNNSNRNRHSSGKHSEKMDQKGHKERDIEIGVLNKFTVKKTKNTESNIEDNQMTRHAGKLWKEKMQKNKNNIMSNTNNVSNNSNINSNLSNSNINNNNYNNYASSSPSQQFQFHNGPGKNSMDYIYNNNFIPTSSKNAYNNFSNISNIPNSAGNMNSSMGNMINTMGNMNNTSNVNNNMNNIFIPNINNNPNNINTMGNVISEGTNVGTTPKKATRSLRDAVNKMQVKSSSPGFSSIVRSVSPNSSVVRSASPNRNR